MGSYGGLSERAFDINEPVIEAQWDFFGSRNWATPGFEPTLANQKSELPSYTRTIFKTWMITLTLLDMMFEPR